MRITITGSLGRIGKPLTRELVQKGHEVTVISSQPDRKKSIEAMGAKAAIGSIEDTGFLQSAFSGADIVYLMEPPPDFFDQTNNIETQWSKIATSYLKAVQDANVKRIVHLSSIGAHTDTGVGMLSAHYTVEGILQQLPEDVAIKFMRPVGFYYNMFAFMQTIKTQDAIIQNYGGDDKEPWVSPFDIAAVIADEMDKPFNGRTIRYIASDEASPNEVARVLGNAIGKPDLKWLVVPDAQMQDGLLNAGFNPQAAEGLTAMNAGRRTGILYEDYYRNKPILGKVKLPDFAKEFADAYTNSK